MEPHDTDPTNDQRKIDRKALTVAIPTALLRRFRLACAAEGRSMSTVAEEALAAWVLANYDAALRKADAG